MHGNGSLNFVDRCDYARLPHAIIPILLGAVFRVWDLTQWIGSRSRVGIEISNGHGNTTFSDDRAMVTLQKNPT
jgi:hypothetical protein